jgi:hypothetical protein
VTKVLLNIINKQISDLIAGLIKAQSSDTAKLIELKSKVQILQTLSDKEQLKFLFDKNVTWKE